mgnify:CR=1 FL=1
MSVRLNPRISTNGLIMALDAGNSKSYPGSGTTWYDISGNGYNATLYNSPTFSNGKFTFNGTNSYAAVTSLNLTSGTYTIIGAARYSGATTGRIITSYANNWLMGHWNTSPGNYYAEGWVVNSFGVISTDTIWRIYAATGNTYTDTWEFYMNGVLNTSNNGGSAGPNGISIGCQGGNSEFSTGDCAFVYAYNRVLTAEEILNSYNALRGRFNI